MEKYTKTRTTIVLEPEVLELGKKQAKLRDQSLSGYLAAYIKSQAVKK